MCLQDTEHWFSGPLCSRCVLSSKLASIMGVVVLRMAHSLPLLSNLCWSHGPCWQAVAPGQLHRSPPQATKTCARPAGGGFSTWQLTCLTSLSLQNGGSLSDCGLAAVAQQLSSLRCLNLKGCRAVTDAGLAFLSGLTCLSRLRLQVQQLQWLAWHSGYCGGTIMDHAVPCHAVPCHAMPCHAMV